MGTSFAKTIRALRGPLTVLLLTGLLLAWLVSSPASAEMLFQSSPVLPTETPSPIPDGQATVVVPPTETLLPTATIEPTATETVEATIPPPTPTAEESATPEPALQPPGPADPTPIPTPTATVDLAGMLLPLTIPTLRPVTVPTPTPAPDRLLVAATLIDRAVGSLAWLWLICGSFLFFVVAGIVVGLGVTGRVSNRRSQSYDAYTDSAFHPYLDTPPTNPGRDPYSPQDDDNWPVSLP